MDQRSKDTQLIAPLRAFAAGERPVVFNGLDAPRSGDGELSADSSRREIAIDPRLNVAVLDLSVPGLDGFEAVRRFLVASPETRVLAITAQDDGPYLRQLIELGVAGYVSQRSSAADLLRGIQTVGNGGLYRDPSIAQRTPADRGTAAELSTREIEVLKLAAAGHSNKTIAAKLQIGSKSVETYKARGMAKLGFHTRVEVVSFALSMGWLSEP